ncbi:MAG TPA: hypothetical protein VGD97_14985 [Lacunisphaera sp.]
MNCHDFHLKGYTVTEFGRRIALNLVWNYPGPERKDSHIEFVEVELYHFSHTQGAILTDIVEEPLDVWVKRESGFIAEADKQDGVRHWAGNAEQYANQLKREGYKVWRIEAAIGLSGFVVAKKLEDNSRRHG